MTFESFGNINNSRTYGATTNVDGKLATREGVRPLQTLIWYPARHGSGTLMTYGDYLDLFTSEDSFSLTPVEAAGVLHKDILDYQADADQAAKMWAEKNAKPDGEKFPLVVYAPNFSAPGFENADLCEYLASYGYVVIASPSIGTHSFNMTNLPASPPVEVTLAAISTAVAMHAGHMGVLQSLERRRSMCRCALKQALMFLER